MMPFNRTSCHRRSRRNRNHKRRRNDDASFGSFEIPPSHSPSLVALILLLLSMMHSHLHSPTSHPSPWTVGVMAGIPPGDGNDDADDLPTPPTLAMTKNVSNGNRVFANVNENYISSSRSVESLTSMIEDDYKKTQMRMRVYWRRIFREIRMSNPVVFPPNDDRDDRDEEEEEEEEEEDAEEGADDVVEAAVVDGGNDGDGDDAVETKGGWEGSKGRRRKGGIAMTTLLPTTTATTAPKRFDGFQTWEAKLQQWGEDVSAYLEEGESRWNELLQPKEKSYGTYDMGSFGVSSIGLKRLTRDEGKGKEEEEEDDVDDDGGGTVTGGEEGGDDYAIVGEGNDDVNDDKIGDGDYLGGDQRQPEVSPRIRRRSRRGRTSSSSSSTSSWPTLSQRLGLDASSVAMPPDITLPITIANLDPNLPPIPKPRPVTPDDVVLPHTDISDLTKNIWIVTTGALPWMTGTAVNPLLRAAYLSNGRRMAGGSVTLMLPWVEREADQIRVYGKKMFDTPDMQETYVRDWLRDTAGMADASVELRIRWYTAWQEVLENSLYSMGDIIGLIPVSFCSHFLPLSPVSIRLVFLFCTLRQMRANEGGLWK